MVSNAAVAHHLVSEYDEAKVVHILHIVLLNIDPVLGEKDIRYCMYGKKYFGPNSLNYLH